VSSLIRTAKGLVKLGSSICRPLNAKALDDQLRCHETPLACEQEAD